VKKCRGIETFPILANVALQLREVEGLRDLSLGRGEEEEEEEGRKESASSQRSVCCWEVESSFLFRGDISLAKDAC